MDFTDQEKKTIGPFFSNLDRGVFVLTNLPEVVKGALFSRYSRTDKSLRRLLLDEFINDKQTGFDEIVSFAGGAGEQQLVATKKAEEFYDRVLVGYGDDSVAELGGAHVACENISNIAAKILEDARLGISPLEKSTRYVYFDKKDEKGNYLYCREPGIMTSRHADLYIETCDSLFDSYAKLVEPMKKYLTEKFPKGEETDRAYNSSIKAKACDVLRGYLPAATLTNVGMFGNGRAFEYLITRMNSSELAEIKQVALELHTELMKSIPSFVKRATGKYGDPTSNFLAQTKSGMQAFYDSNVSAPVQDAAEVTLTRYDPDAQDRVMAAALYPFADMPMAQIRDILQSMTIEQRKKIIDEYIGRRENRRHKPGRGFEHTYYEFDVLMNFASFRDLHRHRVMTQQRQDLTVKHGYDAPAELKEIGADKDFAEKMKQAADAYNTIHKDLRRQAQYVVPFAYKIRFCCQLNLRELYHLVELRSTIHGHPDYRRVVLKMLEEVKKVHPLLVEHMKFVDYREVGLERLESEKKIDVKLKELEKRQG